jgi:hypothetical protein
VRLQFVGRFRELRHGDPDGPSLRSLIREQSRADEANLIEYLTTASIYIWSPGLVGDVMDPRKLDVATPSIATDGVFAWHMDLPYYVATYHVELPDTFVRHAAARDWKPPILSHSDLLELQNKEDAAL